MFIVISGRISATCVGRGNPLLGTGILRSLARQGQSCGCFKNMGLPPQSGVMLMQEEECCLWGSGGGGEYKQKGGCYCLSTSTGS